MGKNCLEYIFISEQYLTVHERFITYKRTHAHTYQCDGLFVCVFCRKLVKWNAISGWREWTRLPAEHERFSFGLHKFARTQNRMQSPALGSASRVYSGGPTVVMNWIPPKCVYDVYDGMNINRHHWYHVLGEHSCTLCAGKSNTNCLKWRTAWFGGGGGCFCYACCRRHQKYPSIFHMDSDPKLIYQRVMVCRRLDGKPRPCMGDFPVKNEVYFRKNQIKILPRINLLRIWRGLN